MFRLSEEESVCRTTSRDTLSYKWVSLLFPSLVHIVISKCHHAKYFAMLELC